MHLESRISIVPLAKMRLVDRPHAFYHVIHEGEATFRMVLRQTVRPGRSSPIHVHGKAPELYIVLQGMLQIRTDKAIVEVPAGHAAFVPAGVPHGVSNPNPSEPAASILLLGADYSKEDVECLPLT